MEASAGRGSRRRNNGALLALPAAIWLAIFFAAPLLIVLVMSFTTRGTTPSDYQLPLTLTNYRETFSPAYQPILERSVTLALKATFICFLIGYPLAFFISTRRRKWVRFLALFLVILPFWTNFLIRTYALRSLLGRRGLLSEIFHFQLGWLDAPLNILNTETAVLIGLVYGFLPFMVLPIYASIERFDFKLVEAGHDLGANDLRVFWRVVLPLTLPGVVAGWILVFIPAVGAFVTPDLLGGSRYQMIGNVIQRMFRGSGGNFPLGSAMSIAVMTLVMLSLLVYFRASGGAHLGSGWLNSLRGAGPRAASAAPTCITEY
ncbi:MAG: ABC transporter permease, partial [Anaerolineae bacterium]|nr:ABC transporter permease [Anaerolineae bacterium]